MEIELTGDELETIMLRIKWEIDAEYEKGRNPFNGPLPELWNKIRPLLNKCDESTKVFIRIEEQPVERIYE